MPQLLESPRPLSRRLALADVPAGGVDIAIVATPDECAALAAINGVPHIAAFEARLRARPWRGDGLEIEGGVHARVTQTCVVTLEDFGSEISEPVSVRFAPPQEAPERQRRDHSTEGHDAHDAQEDHPDELVDGAVDLGAVASEFLTLSLDPYPKKPGAEFVAPKAEIVDSLSPFAVLRSAKAQPGSK